MVSNVTGQLVTAELTDPGYWVEHVRRPVRFLDGIRALAEQGVTRFLELGPDAVLTAMAGQCLDEASDVSSCRRCGRASRRRTRSPGSSAAAHVAGVAVDWPAFYAGTGAHQVDLPTYAFQRERYWLSAGAGAGDPAAAGLERLDHPLLAAAVRLGDRDEWLFTGRLSTDTQPWVAEHVLLGNAVVPGTAYVELAIAAGRRAGTAVLQELVIEAPLILPDGVTVALQVSVGEADADGRREVAIYTRPGSGSSSGARDGELEATRHARGVLAPAAGARPPPRPAWSAQWPPAGAEPVAVDALYTGLSDIGYDYGPVFQGLQAVWRDGDQVYAEVALPAESADAAAAFGIHPALFDAALQSGTILAGVGIGAGANSQRRMPFSWSDARIERQGATRLRVRAVLAGDSVRLDAVDESGAEVVSVAAITFRPVDQAQLEGGRRSARNSLFTVDWTPVQAVTGSARVAMLDGLDVDSAGAGRRGRRRTAGGRGRRDRDRGERAGGGRADAGSAAAVVGERAVGRGPAGRADPRRDRGGRRGAGPGGVAGVGAGAQRAVRAPRPVPAP